MKTVFRRNILIRTDDLLISFYISIRYDLIFILRENYWSWVYTIKVNFVKVGQTFTNFDQDAVYTIKVVQSF